MVDSLGVSAWFTTLDLHASYWKVEVAEGDKDKTAFTTHQGLCRLVRMPFGLTNAPSPSKDSWTASYTVCYGFAAWST